MYLKSGKNKEVIKNYWTGTWEIRSPKCKGDGAAECQFRERQKVEAEIRGQTVDGTEDLSTIMGNLGRRNRSTGLSLRLVLRTLLGRLLAYNSKKVFPIIVLVLAVTACGCPY